MAAATTAGHEPPLNVIALVSGGKDSFYSLLHAQHNGHRVVALANLHPPLSSAADQPIRDPSGNATDQAWAGCAASGQGDVPDGPIGSVPAGRASPTRTRTSDEEPEQQQEEDLNSFMYQTVGHQVIPLYAEATGLPLFRQPIVGTAVHQGISYSHHRWGTPGGGGRERDSAARSADRPARDDDEDLSLTSGAGQPRPEPSVGHRSGAPGPAPVAAGVGGGSGTDAASENDDDETESLVPLLRAVMRAHPEANAICTGAILSTYQRTRVESVALRLGLVPLAYLWQYPVLPGPDHESRGSRAGAGADDARLLRDMAGVSLDARIIKVASAGLDEQFLWTNVADEQSAQRIQRALRKFGGGGRGSVLGEGGEFETLVVDGPPSLFRRRIVVQEEARRVVREGGGSTWLNILAASTEVKAALDQGSELTQNPHVRVPPMLEARFQAGLEALRDPPGTPEADADEGNEDMIPDSLFLPMRDASPSSAPDSAVQWNFSGDGQLPSIEEQTSQVVEAIRERLLSQSLEFNAITGAIIILRHMSDFPIINNVYGTLFREPNPPARVTIACGEGLPSGCGIAIYLSVRPAHKLADGLRKGLHVQSRSYWAPANIGPYSQAIDVPLTEAAEQDDNGSSVRAVTIAGQIPLIPASMALPADDDSFQIILSLQHLWRVAVEMKVQWWTGAAIYFPRSTSDASRDMKQKAVMARRAWRSAHLWSSSHVDEAENEDDEDGPDLWDRRYNPAYMTLGGADEASGQSASLPDWDVLASQRGSGEELDVDRRKRQAVPCLFAAEVEQLPRSAACEWHAHRGLGSVGAGRLHVRNVRTTLRVESQQASVPVEVQHVSVTSGDQVVVHTTVSVLAGSADLADSLESVASPVVMASLGLAPDRGTPPASARPWLVYAVDASTWHSRSRDGHYPAVIPCRSLWSARGQRLSAVLLYENRFSHDEMSSQPSNH